MVISQRPKESCERHVRHLVQPLAGAIGGHGGGASGFPVSPTIQWAHVSFDLLDGFFSRVNMSGGGFIIPVLISWCRSCWRARCHELWDHWCRRCHPSGGAALESFRCDAPLTTSSSRHRNAPPPAWPPWDWTLKCSRTWKSPIRMKVRNLPTSTESWRDAKLLRFATDGGCVFWRRL